MHIVVCVKQVPDSAQIRVHPVTNTIMRQGVPTIINPYDLFSLEEALRLRDRHGGEVTVVTMGPPMADTALRKCLTFGADRAVLLTDRFFAGSDTLATSYALSFLIKKVSENWGAPDLIFCGKQTIDGDTAQVGPGVAKRLNLLQLTYVSKIESFDMEAREITVDRRAEGGIQVLKTKLPCLITMLEGTNDIRRGSIEDALRGARTEIITWNAAQAGITDLTLCGLRGSPTIVKKVFAPKPRDEKAFQIEVEGKSMSDISDALIAEIGKRQPVLERDMLKGAMSY
ncbi:electron transfer flavoprotein subunit beta/FixA family protein [Methylocapsa acidiphila]|uniref:electron transfer flavoprotein subunit beta/FixA family protein n=1 Tax=Methylocapsa acidiphila TaxID=133552 RepID=UPI00041BF29F|nr:electron transfer flavoprotein subunit beta/FixA family protein [Methylocapsa acidiphila]